MGKASRWLRSLLTFKKPSDQPPSSSKAPKDKTRWSLFVKSGKKHSLHVSSSALVNDHCDAVDPDNHAIAVAAATAAVAEAAMTAARAAAAVVKLTGSGVCDNGFVRCVGLPRELWAAVVVQSAFRGYLARRALIALKALVRLQALVRGHIARKQTADQVRQMKALLRVQARARAGRALLSESSQSSSKSSYHHPPGPATPEKFEEICSRSAKRNQPSVLKRNTSKSESLGSGCQIKTIRGTNQINCMGERVWNPLMRTGPLDDQHSYKIPEVDPSTCQRKNLFNASHRTLASDNQRHSHATLKDSSICLAAPSSNKYASMPLSPSRFSCELEEEASYCTAENSPRFYSASSVGGGSSRGGPYTPTKSDSLHSYLSGYSDYPNYMSYTESSKAKLRSMSAPKQRPQYERSSSTRRYSNHSVNESKSGALRLSAMHASYANKAYPGSGRLDKLGMPMGGDPYASMYGLI